MKKDTSQKIDVSEIKERMSAIRSVGKRVHVIPQRGRWVVKSEGKTKASGIFKVKEEAIKKAQSISKEKPDIVVLIHRKDGTVENLAIVAKTSENKMTNTIKGSHQIKRAHKEG